MEPVTIVTVPAEGSAQQRVLDRGESVGRPLYSPDGRWVFVPATSGVYRYDTATYSHGRLMVSWKIDYWQDAYVDVTSDGKTLAAATNLPIPGPFLVGIVHLISVEDGRELSVFDVPLDDSQDEDLEDIRFSPDGTLLALNYHRRGPIVIWSLAEDKLLYEFQGDSLEFSANSRLMTLEDEGHVYLYDLNSGERLRDWPGERSAFLPGNRLAVESNGTVRVFDLNTGEVQLALYGRFAAFSSDGQLAALLSWGQLRIHRVSDGVLLARMEDEHGLYRTADEAILRFAPDGKTIAVYTSQIVCCGGMYTSLSLWRVADGTLLLRNPKGDPMGDTTELFGFAPDGRSFIVTFHGDTAVQIWDTTDGSVLASID